MAGSSTYTSDDLLDSVKRRALVPEGQITLTDSDLLRFANEEMDENLGPLILSMREEYYLTFVDVPMPADGITFSIPYRAFGTKIRIIKPVTPDGKVGAPFVPVPIDVQFNYTTLNYSPIITGFYLENNTIKFINSLTSSGVSLIRIYFYLRPNNLVVMARGGKVTAINGNVLTLATVPSNIATGLIDTIEGKANYRILSYDSTVVVNSVAKTVTFTTLPTGISVGDYICSAGETVCPQIPTDVHPLLEQSVACKILEALNDTEGLKNAYIRLKKIEERIFNLIDNRIEAPGRKVMNQQSFIRRGVRGRYGGVY